ncbi:unnamed protein product [Parascedosporium putredinis]|uniref:rRNA-processing protein EFG1 n=1 Tax=Parascedosporium putredinis TaxID=1442378 RepID=A0A9P1M6W3_9PEZI|nr:unnamed protein product [Parascedosporium putredinis]CAI7989265.1 unnamed protein product [Parascedosporium putredinis]
MQLPHQSLIHHVIQDRGDKQRQRKVPNQTKDGSINALKKRVRTIERLFNKGSDVPGNTKVELERELAAHKATITELTYRKKRSEMIKKYHMVRFFERQKAERLVKQLTKQLKTAESDEIKAQLHVAEGSAADESTTPTAKAALDAERPPMWKEIEEALARGPRALEKMRDRNPDGDVVDPEGLGFFGFRKWNAGGAAATWARWQQFIRRNNEMLAEKQQGLDKPSSLDGEDDNDNGDDHGGGDENLESFFLI